MVQGPIVLGATRPVTVTLSMGDSQTNRLVFRFHILMECVNSLLFKFLLQIIQFFPAQEMDVKM